MVGAFLSFRFVRMVVTELFILVGLVFWLYHCNTWNKKIPLILLNRAEERATFERTLKEALDKHGVSDPASRKRLEPRLVQMINYGARWVRHYEVVRSTCMTVALAYVAGAFLIASTLIKPPILPDLQTALIFLSIVILLIGGLYAVYEYHTTPYAGAYPFSRVLGIRSWYHLVSLRATSSPHHKETQSYSHSEGVASSVMHEEEQSSGIISAITRSYHVLLPKGPLAPENRSAGEYCELFRAYIRDWADIACDDTGLKPLLEDLETVFVLFNIQQSKRMSATTMSSRLTVAFFFATGILAYVLLVDPLIHYFEIIVRH